MTSINKFNKNITSKIDEFVNSNSELTNNDIIENSIINLDNVKHDNENLENNLNNGEILLDTKDIINLDTQDIIKQKKQKSKPLENKQKNIKPKKLSTKVPIVKDSIVQESIVQESTVQESTVQESTVQESKKPKTRKKIQSKDESKDESKEESKNMDISNLPVSKKLTKPKKDIIPKVPKISKVQKNKSKKSDISNQDNEDIEDKLIGDKKIRSFKVKLPDKEEYEGRFTGLTPYQAANKALSKYFRECERIDEEIKFSICESTRKSKKTIYSYYGRRQKLDIPVTYKIKDGDTEREIVKNFKNTLKKIKKIDTKNEQLLINA